jgi:hypothetical protein
MLALLASFDVGADSGKWGHPYCHLERSREISNGQGRRVVEISPLQMASPSSGRNDGMGKLGRSDSIGMPQSKSPTWEQAWARTRATALERL